MKKELAVNKSVRIGAPSANVWKALTDPAVIKQYLFGTQVITDWKVGGSIVFTGNYQGKEYRDKGTILRFAPEKVLEHTYWSGFSRLPDIPENYSVVTYQLSPEGNETLLTLTQSNFADETSCNHSSENWDGVLQAMKKLVEE
jgi:uncharacterized protein YndB with AHSA1/START domain